MNVRKTNLKTALALTALAGGVLFATGGGPATAAEPEVVTATSVNDRVIQDSRIRESSGLAASTYKRKTLFTHNDSGDSARLFALGADGATQATFTLDGAQARDWEDMSAGPRHKLWLGDIGDNPSSRDSIQVYRVTEPEKLASASLTWKKYEFIYEDGAHNAEALLVNPVSGQLFIATKASQGAGIYRAPRRLSTTKTNVLTRVGDAPALITAGAFFPDGERFVLRSQNWAWVYSGLGGNVRTMRLPDSQQGESIDVHRSSRYLFSGSEGVKSPVDRVTADFGTGGGGGDDGGDELGWEPKAPAVPGNGSVTPETFGAVADGVHDDSAALQDAINEAALTGAKVKLAANRTYLSSRRLTTPSGTFLQGAGSSSVLKFDWEINDSTHDGFYLGNTDQVQNGNTDLTFRDFKVLGAANGLPQGPNSLHDEPQVPAIRLRLVDRFHIENVEISHAPGISLIYQGSSNGLVRGNYIHHSGRDGINSTWHDRNMHDVIVEDNLITKIGDDGIAVIGAPGQTPNTEALPYNIAVRNNEIIGWPDNPNGLQIGRGISVLAATKVLLSGNTIDRTHSTGILITRSTRDFSYDPKTEEPWQSSDIEVVDNRIIDAGQAYTQSSPGLDEPGHDGVTVKGSNHVTIKGNTITNPYGKAITLFSCEACDSQ